MVSVPIPHPISSTFLPLHRSKSAKPGICDSTKYLRASTSSEYSFVPTGLGEWRMLQGRESQYSLTFWIEVFSNDILNYSVLAENSGVTRPFECESSLPDLAALARPPAPTPAPPYPSLRYSLTFEKASADKTRQQSITVGRPPCFRSPGFRFLNSGHAVVMARTSASPAHSAADAAYDALGTCFFVFSIAAGSNRVTRTPACSKCFARSTPCDSSITSVCGLYDSPRMPTVPLLGSRARMISVSRGTCRRLS